MASRNTSGREKVKARMTRKITAAAIHRYLLAATLAGAVATVTPVRADSFTFSTGNADGRLASLSQPARALKLETETADDFILTETTSIKGATITGLIPAGTPLSSIKNVEIEIYHVFPTDSVTPPSNRVPTRMNSPADVEIDSATRDGSRGTLAFRASLLKSGFSVQNTVVTGIKAAPANVTHGEGPATGDAVEISISFDPPIVLPSDHYFFRPEVEVIDGDFLYLSAPRPIVSPGTPFLGDLQAWIRNIDLKPDWLRIGTDIIGGSPAPTFNMTFALSGETIPDAGTPGKANCHGKTISALARQFGGISAAATTLGFSSVAELQGGMKTFCGE
jgi:hypothetical protein